MEVIGLIPAAGMGTRLSPIPCSKELFPVGFSGNSHPKVVSHYLLDCYRLAGAEQVYFVLRKGKWDIPAYFGDGSVAGLNIAYLIMQRPYGTPYSLDQAYPFVKDKHVLFGFPDILIEPQDAFLQLQKRREEKGAEVVVGIFDIKAGQEWDITETDQDGKVTGFKREKVLESAARGWAIACWGPEFTAFMHHYLGQVQQEIEKSDLKREVRVGEVLQAAISNGLEVQSVYFSAGKCLDVGTPENLLQAIQTLT